MNPVVPLRGTCEAHGSGSVGCAALHARLFTGDRYAVANSAATHWSTLLDPFAQWLVAVSKRVAAAALAGAGYVAQRPVRAVFVRQPRLLRTGESTTAVGRNCQSVREFDGLAIRPTAKSDTY